MANFNTTKAFAAGVAAYESGVSHCPHAPRGGSSARRIQWWSGWLDARLRLERPNLYRMLQP